MDGGIVDRRVQRRHRAAVDRVEVARERREQLDELALGQVELLGEDTPLLLELGLPLGQRRALQGFRVAGVAEGRGERQAGRADD